MPASLAASQDAFAGTARSRTNRQLRAMSQWFFADGLAFDVALSPFDSPSGKIDNAFATL
jgi:hypothetical protein